MRNADNRNVFKILTLFWLAFCLIVNRANAAFEYKVFGSRSAGAGSTGFASRLTSFATLNNPAKILLDEKLRMDVYYRNFYGINGLDLMGLDIHGRYRGVPFGVAFSGFGNTNYQETEVHIAAACEFLKGLFALKIKWYNLEISHYGNAVAFAVDAMGLYQVHESLSMGFGLYNCNEPVIGSCREKIPGALIMGLEYIPATGIWFRCDVVKADEEAFDYRFGTEFKLVENIALLIGFRDSSNTLSGGLVFEKGNMQFSYSYEYHPFLGGSNTISAGYGI